MTFEEDLTKRRIDVVAFAAGDPARYAEWQEMYSQMHPNSFYVSVKMILNDVRRRFWLAEAAKPVVTTDVPAKPVTRRASISATGAPKPAVESPVAVPTTESTEAKPAAVPGKGRAVIPRATPAKTETSGTSASTPSSPDKSAPEETPKALRARPVIRRPTPATENTDTPATEQEQIAQDGTNAVVPFHTNPDPEAETEDTPKPPRPRPVFRKPATASPVEQPAAETPDKSLPNADETVVPATEQTKSEEVKPPRPRPIFKRPVENTSATEPKPETTMPPVNNAESKDGLVSEINEPEPAAKPPRPRPIIRRPNTAPEPIQPPVLPETVPLEVKSPEETPTPPATEAPKPPRPRPIFKRPAKPDDLNG